MQSDTQNSEVKSAKVEQLRKIAKLMDSQFKIPGTNFSFGLDPILGLIPGLGDYSGVLSGLAFVVLAKKNGASNRASLMMLKNIVKDYFIGLIPVLGKAFDFFYKNHKKNIKIFEENILEHKHNEPTKPIVFVIIFAILFLGLILSILVVWLMVKAYKFLIAHYGQGPF
ncbi:MAG: DUF4112 domain-containing protein [Chitinophagales bacterium]|jgi:hypothetical protein|nr:DUF4112 domain-containing protein [Chitinophagales bacterium]